MENYRGQFYTQARTEKEYPEHEPFPVRKVPLPF
jgi:hypothetical protein